jgi:hypothetical protein
MKALLVTVAILIATPAFAQDVSLVGTWTGQRDRIAKVEGRRGGLATLVVTEQQGNTFTGRLKRSNATGDEEEPLWGAFTPGGRLIMGTDDEGTYMFSLVDANTLDYCYTETGRSPRGVREADPTALTVGIQMAGSRRTRLAGNGQTGTARPFPPVVDRL